MNSSARTLRIFLARHGQSTLNLQQRISGQAECGLSEKGWRQALALADVLRHEPLSAIYASSLQRAMQTARPAAENHGLPISAISDLCEIGFGVLEGRYVDERDSEARHLWEQRVMDKRGFKVTGGENYADFEARVLRCLERILAASSGSILIVGHRNTNEVILARLLAESSIFEPDVNVKNEYLYAIRRDPGVDIQTIRLGGERHGLCYPGLIL